MKHRLHLHPNNSNIMVCFKKKKKKKKRIIFLFYIKESALGVSNDEQKSVFALTASAGKLPALSKKRDTQNSVPPRRQKTSKKSTTYKIIKIIKFKNSFHF
jgi:hypothetical protein